MCIQNTLQQHILNITNGGKTIADFFHATMQGETRNAKIYHQMEAAKQLTKLALTHTPSVTPRALFRHSRLRGNPSANRTRHTKTPLPPRRGKAGMGVKILPILYILLVPHPSPTSTSSITKSPA